MSELLIVAEAKDNRLTLLEGVCCAYCNQYICSNDISDDERIQKAIDHNCREVSNE